VPCVSSGDRFKSVIGLLIPSFSQVGESQVMSVI